MTGWAPRLVSLVRLIVLFTVVLGGFAIGSTIYALYLHEHVSAARPPAPALPPLRRPRAALEWRDELPDATCTSGQRVRAIGPTEAKVDGATLLVGLLWLVGAQADGLHVAAFDAVTLKPQWVAGPYPSVGGEGRMPRHSLTVLDGMVVLGDTDGLLRVLDARTGEELRTRAKLYDVEIAGLGYGSWVEKVRAEGDELYVVANLELHVLDARTGAVTRRLSTL